MRFAGQNEDAAAGGRWRGLVAVVAAIGLVVLSGCATQRGRRAPVSYTTASWSYGRAQGRKISTAHYDIYTTLRDEVLLGALPGFVEAAYENYQQLLPSTRQVDERMKVYLFATRGQWERFTRRFTGSRSKLFLKVRNGGYSERGVSVIEYVAHQITFPLFAHEGFHQYVYHYVNSQIPSWLNEGLAVTCEGQRWGMHGLKAFEAEYNPRRRNDVTAALVSNRLHSLRRLLETHPGEVIEGSNRSVVTYYAQVWSLILFLREGADGKYATAFERLLSQLDEVDIAQYARAAHIWSDRKRFSFGEALFRSFISEDLDTVEREYFEFMRERFLGRG